MKHKMDPKFVSAQRRKARKNMLYKGAAVAPLLMMGIGGMASAHAATVDSSPVDSASASHSVGDKTNAFGVNVNVPPATPDTPSTPSTATPDAPSTPSTATPDAPSTPATPDAPSTPATPDAPSIPSGTDDAEAWISAIGSLISSFDWGQGGAPSDSCPGGDCGGAEGSCPGGDCGAAAGAGAAGAGAVADSSCPGGDCGDISQGWDSYGSYTDAFAPVYA